jgi:uncharacterized SAM-binding protein YcdF (DUF218 family)
MAGFLTAPSNVLLVLGVAGLLLTAMRVTRLGRFCLVLSVAGLAVFGLSPAGNLLIRPLEQRFPPWDASRGAPHGIIILGGAVSSDVSHKRGEAVLNESAERLTVAATLARRYPDARIVFTGGSGEIVATEGTEAEVAGPLLESFGIDRGRITLEDRSRTTIENAVFTKRLVMPRPGERWLLVTSAYHMPRAMGVFRAADFSVEAYPVDWRTGDTAMTGFYLVSDGLKRSDTAMREWIGLAGYFLAGTSSALFPAPP